MGCRISAIVLADIDLFSHPRASSITNPPTERFRATFTGRNFTARTFTLPRRILHMKRSRQPESYQCAHTKRHGRRPGTSAGMNSTSKPQCAPPMVNHPLATTAPGPEANGIEHAGSGSNSKSAHLGFRIQESIGEACAHGGRIRSFIFRPRRRLQSPRRTLR